MQINLFAEETQLQRLSELGDSLEKLNVIDFESFRPLLEKVNCKERKSKAGRPSFDPARMDRIRRQLLFRYRAISATSINSVKVRFSFTSFLFNFGTLALSRRSMSLVVSMIVYFAKSILGASASNATSHASSDGKTSSTAHLYFCSTSVLFINFLRKICVIL